MAIIKNAKNINIQVNNEYTSICKVSYEESEEVIIEATKENLELSSQKKTVMQGFGKDIDNGYEEEDNPPKEKYIHQIYFSDKNGKKINSSDFGERIYVHVDFKKEAIGKSAIVKIIEYDWPDPSDDYHSFKITSIKRQNNSFGLTLEYQKFDLEKDKKAELFIVVSVYEEKKILERYEQETYISIHMGDTIYNNKHRLLFNGGRLYHINEKDKIIWSTIARSGIGKHMNKSTSTKLKNEGAIPKGGYQLVLNDKILSKGGVNVKGYEAERSKGGWGAWARRLTPKSSTETFGRDSFFLHEDGNEDTPGKIGSLGCIATSKLLRGINYIKNIVRFAYDKYGEGHKINVDADYTFNVENILYKTIVQTFLYDDKNAIIKTIEKNTLLNGTGDFDGWKIKVKYDNNIGWVNSRYIE